MDEEHERIWMWMGRVGAFMLGVIATLSTLLVMVSTETRSVSASVDQPQESMSCVVAHSADALTIRRCESDEAVCYLAWIFHDGVSQDCRWKTDGELEAK